MHKSTRSKKIPTMVAVTIVGGDDAMYRALNKAIQRENRKRIARDEVGDEWYHIPRGKCQNPSCGRIHRMLPDFLLPYKHYKEEVISGVLDGVVTSDDLDSEDRPSQASMDRWILWFILNRLNIEGYLRSNAYRELDYTEEVFTSGRSLLDKFRRSSHGAWLCAVIRIIYNSGGFLPAVCA